MLDDGSYVRMVLAPKAQRGTIHLSVNHKGDPQYLFRLDPRFKHKQDDFFINDGDVEECYRPSDEEVRMINMLIDNA